MENILSQKQFDYESDFKSHLTIELRKRLPTVFVEFNILNLFLNDIDEYMKYGYKFIPKNSSPVIDIIIDYKNSFFAIELKYTFFKNNKEIGQGAKTTLNDFIGDIKKVMGIETIKEGYCIYLNNAKDFINKKINELNDKDQLLIKGYEWMNIENPYQYSYIIKKIIKEVV